MDASMGNLGLFFGLVIGLWVCVRSYNKDGMYELILNLNHSNGAFAL